MIKFFRKIRQRLLVENKFSKYLLYAIGEIVLVVIGILIALQINNWNEERKLEQVERKVLTEIQENLVSSQQNIDQLIHSHKNHIQNYRVIRQHIDQDLPYDDSLSYHFAKITVWSSPFLTFTAYENLKIKGIDLISNDSLKDMITDLYEVQFSLLVKDLDRAEWRNSESVVLPYFTDNFRYIDTPEGERTQTVPNDYDEVMNDPDFENILSMLIFMRKAGIRYAENTNRQIKELVEAIDGELQERE